ncbi:putative RNase toxin 35 of polymorphic toxin system [Leucobacter luti]|uniref:Putative RNase toxin 35 of polymorphic toxin system n=1 Tax=Leucobacter luti TaxID=340320 RepID=A0A4R6S2C7_9MICO|nr:putative RNase toxin 35 of polymorphic toxin system [Leucobacter luti]
MVVCTHYGGGVSQGHVLHWLMDGPTCRRRPVRVRDGPVPQLRVRKPWPRVTPATASAASPYALSAPTQLVVAADPALVATAHTGDPILVRAGALPMREQIINVAVLHSLIPQAFPAGQTTPAFWGILIKLLQRGWKYISQPAQKIGVQSGTKRFLLKQNAAKWSHIMAPKHKWSAVGARTKTQVANVMAKTMSAGRHTLYKGNPRVGIATMKYKGRSISVTYDIKTKRVGNGWVR